MPLITALLQQNSAGRFSWHMPGHTAGRQWPVWLRDNLYLLDTTELPVNDDLMAPTGPALQSLNRVSEYNNAAWSRYLTCGSTVGILAMLAAYPGRGGRILMSPICHQSVMHAAALLNFEIGWITPGLWPQAPLNSQEPVTLLPQVSLEDVKQAANNFGSFDAVFLTSPDYYGSCAEISDIAEFAHSQQALVLVDEAHGAHLSMSHASLPASAMRQGADLCVQSLHKTLPALTPAAMLFVSEDALVSGRAKLPKVESALKIFHTSSPSYVIAASAEYAEYWLHEQAPSLVDLTIDRISKMAQELENDYFFAPMEQIESQSSVAERDPLRIVISHRDGRAMDKTAEFISSLGIDVEMHDVLRLILIPALDQAEDEFIHLTRALKMACCETVAAINSKTRLEHGKLDEEWKRIIAQPPLLQINPSEVLLTNHKYKQIDLESAAGLISAAAIVPYPPGIPLVWPGEMLSPEKLDFIFKLSENSVNLIGISNKKLHVLM